MLSHNTDNPPSPLKVLPTKDLNEISDVDIFLYLIPRKGVDTAEFEIHFKVVGPDRQDCARFFKRGYTDPFTFFEDPFSRAGKVGFFNLGVFAMLIYLEDIDRDVHTSG